ARDRAWTFNRAFGEGETNREIREIGGRRHHHGMGRAVEGEGDRRFLRHRAGRGRHFSAPPRKARNAEGRWRRLAVTREDFIHSAASTVSAMWRLLSACSR